MKVLHFIENFSQPSETFIKSYVEKSCQFADVAVASFNFHNVPPDVEKKVKLFKINNPVFGRKNIAGIKRYLHEKITGEVVWYTQFNQVLNNFKPDIIHCHFGPVGVMTMQFKNQYNNSIPYTTSFYGYDISSLPVVDKRYSENLKKLWLHGTGFFAEGPGLMKKAVALGCSETKFSINPLLISIENYPLKIKYRSTSEPIKFLFASRFVEKKGLQLFLEAIRKLSDHIKDFTIDIIGSGPMQQTYREIIANYKLDKFIKWHEFMGHNEIIAIMKDYDFLVHPSLTAVDQDSEGGAPTIIIEAQAVGLPVITTDHADIPFVMGYHDFLAKENDVQSLMSVIKNILDCNNIQHYAQQGIAQVSEQHNLITNTSYETNLRIVADQCLE